MFIEVFGSYLLVWCSMKHKTKDIQIISSIGDISGCQLVFVFKNLVCKLVAFGAPDI